MSEPRPVPSRRPGAGPPTKHQLALMIWLAVFPTLTVLNLVARRLAAGPVTGRADLRPGHDRRARSSSTALMPQLHRVRVWLLNRR